MLQAAPILPVLIVAYRGPGGFDQHSAVRWVWPDEVMPVQQTLQLVPDPGLLANQALAMGVKNG